MAFSDPGESCQVDKNKSTKIEASVGIELTQSYIEWTSLGPEAYKASTLKRLSLQLWTFFDFFIFFLNHL